MVKKFKKGRKTRSAGRFGPRYGTKIRKLIADIEEKSKRNTTVPNAGVPNLGGRALLSGDVPSAVIPLLVALTYPSPLLGSRLQGRSRGSWRRIEWLIGAPDARRPWRSITNTAASGVPTVVTGY